jgi:DNA-binding transcriptional ArsR family regulator
VRATLVLGVAASVVANVLHALDNPISQAIAAWPPLALLLTVELISRVPVHRRSLAFCRLLATATIAGIAAWVSYWHMAGVAARYGEVGAAPYLIPLSVDGLIVVASICLVELSGRIQAEASKPVIVPDTKADKKPDTQRTRKRDTGAAVIRLRSRHPDLSNHEIADRLGITDRTVRRHLSAAA